MEQRKLCHPPPCRPLVRPRTSLRFSPTAWAKLLFLRDCGDTEVGGFGISATEDLLYVTDLRLIQQSCSAVSVAFDDTAVADFYDEQVDRGLEPEQFSRIWMHTHPGNSAAPSDVDEGTFARVFGRTDWSVMFILARLGNTYARLSFSSGPGGACELPVGVDYCRPFMGSAETAWQAEYADNVICEEPFPMPQREAEGRSETKPFWVLERNWDA